VEAEAQEERNERIRRERMELPLDQRLGRAMGHPLRATLLAKLNTSPAAASDLDQEFKEAGEPVPLSNISYHVRELWRWGLIEVVSTEPVRGATKTVYRGITKMQLSDDSFKAMSAESQDGIVIEAVKEAYDRIKAAIEGGTFAKNENSHIITAIPSVDKQGFDEIADLIAETYGRIDDIAAAAVNRETDPAKRVRATVSLLSYESPAGDS
jgi:Helix-turn-helix domain